MNTIDMKLPGWIGENTASSTLAALARFKNHPVRLWIDSEGGEVFYAIQMFEALQLHRPLTTIVNGRADSAASIVFLAGFPRIIEENSTMLIHDPRLRDGRVTDDKTARDWLAGAYAVRTRIKKNQILDMMRRETVLTADEAVRLGFAHTIARAKPRTNDFKRLAVPGAPCN